MGEPSEEPAAAPYTGPTITHQAIEYLPDHGRPDSHITRCWSRWTDGRVTHQDTRSVFMTEFLPSWPEERLPPAGLKWIDTVAALREVEAAKPPPNPAT